MLELFYEDLRDRYDASILEIESFLGVEPRPLKPVTARREARPLHMVVENYPDLERAFRRTEFHRFFSA